MTIPAGLYVDEASIGYNAALLSKTGSDEYGKHFPLYFKAFGEYKNPIYIYTTSLSFRIFGINEFTLRMTSVVFFFIFMFFGYKFVKERFSNNKVVIIYFLLSAGYLPWFFTISRISFEVISYVALLSIIVYLILQTFHRDKGHIFLPFITGVTIAMSIYTYSTSRILSPLLFISIILVYLKKENIKKLIDLSIGFLLTTIPLILFYLRNTTSLTQRFQNISYINRSGIPTYAKVTIFIQQYFEHFSIKFLLINGDSNLRHSTSFGGEVQIAVIICFIISIWYFKKLCQDKLFIILIMNFLFSPVASAFTYQTPHALRSVTMGFYILFISWYGFYFLLKQKQYFLLYILLTLLILQNIFYVVTYFKDYRYKSIHAFNNYDYKQSLVDAYSQNPRTIYVYGQLKIYELFYKQVMGKVKDIPFIYLTTSQINPGLNLKKACILYPDDKQMFIRKNTPASCAFLKKNYLINIKCCN